MEMAPTRWRYEVGAHGDGVPLMLWLQGGGWPGSVARASGRGQIHGRLDRIWPGWWCLNLEARGMHVDEWRHVVRGGGVITFSFHCIFFVVGGGTVTVQVCSKSFTPLLANILPSMLLLPFYGRSASILGHWKIRGKGRCGAFVELTTSR